MWYLASMSRHLIVIAVAISTLPSCAGSCGGEPDGVGHAESGVFVDCDARGYTVRNTGDDAAYVIVPQPCLLDPARLPPLGPHGALPDSVVVHGAGIATVEAVGETIPAGGSKRVDFGGADVGVCEDYTNAPPGQHERGPTPLVAGRAPRGMMLHLHVQEPGSLGPGWQGRVVCTW
jgi:hypothetical protein